MFQKLRKFLKRFGFFKTECVIIAPERPNREIGTFDSTFAIMADCDSVLIDLRGSFGGYSAAYIDEIVKCVAPKITTITFITTNKAYKMFVESAAKRRNAANVKVDFQNDRQNQKDKRMVK